MQDDDASEVAEMETSEVAEMETVDEKTNKFTEALTGSCRGVEGILRKRARSADGITPGRQNIPYPHQRKCARRAFRGVLTNTDKPLLVCHPPGTGKTFTCLLIVAGMHTISNGVRRKTLISSPASCLDQWKSACLDTLRIPEKRILTTNKMDMVTLQTLEKYDIVIVTRDLVGRAYSSCHEWVTRHHKNERGNWLSRWDRKPGSLMHPLFESRFDLVLQDEVHFMRNPLTAWTKGHELLSSRALKVVGASATPVMSQPRDCRGIATAMNLPSRFKEEGAWFKDRQRTIVNLDTIREFCAVYTDRVKDSVLNLPPITDHYVNFDALIPPEHVEDYNEAIASARRIRVSLERRGRGSGSELQKLMAYLQTLQQFLVSPLLAEKGAQSIKGAAGKDVLLQAAAQETGALQALKHTIDQLQSEGFMRVMVAVCHVSLMKVAEVYLREKRLAGQVLLYHGGMSLKKRGEATAAFLRMERTVLIMSIDAGGTGLNLVPGANAVVFWGSRPFSPMQVLQTKKRVHRIGQHFPVKVVHLIAKGSVDAAINEIHNGKLALARAVMDNDLSALESSDGKWRATGRIVDNCRLLTKEGQFEDVEPRRVLPLTLQRPPRLPLAPHPQLPPMPNESVQNDVAAALIARAAALAYGSKLLPALASR